MLRIFFVLLLLSTIYYQPSTGFAGGAGTAGASFLNIGMGVRPAGMGGAFTGIADDANAIYYNPAGLIQLKVKELTAIHTTWLAEVEAQYLGFATPIGEENAFGLSGTYLHTEDIERDILGKELGTFRDSYSNLNLSYARALRKDLYVGTTLKWIYGSLAEHEASTYGLDLGLLYKTPIKGLSLGTTIQNIGGRMSFIEEEDPLPLNLKFGIGYRPIEDLVFGCDVARSNTTDEFRLGLGGEYTIARVLSLRAGYAQKGDDEFSGITAGAGVNLFGLQLDYAWVPYGALGDTNRYSLLLRLDTSAPTQPLVKDQGEYTRDKNTLHFLWSSEDRESGIERYRYALGTSPGKADVVPWMEVEIRGQGSGVKDQGSGSSGQRAEGSGQEAEGSDRWREITVRGLELVDGTTYYLSVKARNRAGLFSSWSGIGTSDGITIDTIPPSTPGVKDEGEYTTNNQRLYAEWASGDKTSGIARYEYGVGTGPGKVDVVPWRTIEIVDSRYQMVDKGVGDQEAEGRRQKAEGSDRGREITLMDLDLVDGTTYYFSVKARDRAGNISEIGTSDGILIDASPPSVPLIRDEGEYTTNPNVLGFHFQSNDPHSGIKSYRYALGTIPGGSDVSGWKETQEKGVILPDLSLTSGASYYLSVRATNGAGLTSEIGISDGIMVDTTPPSTPLVKVRGEKWEVGSIFYVSWSSEDRIGMREKGEGMGGREGQGSGIAEYLYAVGTSPKGIEISDWTSAGEKAGIELVGLNLEAGKTYYVSVKARNKAGLWSEVGTSDGVQVVAPQMPETSTPLPSTEIPKVKNLKTEEPKNLINQSPITNYQSGDGSLRMAAQVYEDPDYVKIYVHLKNAGDDEDIYPVLLDFTLLTKDGESLLPSPYRTSIIENHFSCGFILPNSEIEGFIIFNTKESPGVLIYSDHYGNRISMVFLIP